MKGSGIDLTGTSGYDYDNWLEFFRTKTKTLIQTNVIQLNSSGTSQQEVA